MCAVFSFCLRDRHRVLWQHCLECSGHRLQVVRPWLWQQLKLLQTSVAETLEKEPQLGGQVVSEPELCLPGPRLAEATPPVWTETNLLRQSLQSWGHSRRLHWTWKYFHIQGSDMGCSISPWVSVVRRSAVSASSWPDHCAWSPARIRNMIIWTMELLSLL